MDNEARREDVEPRMMELKINFTQIRQRVEAAASLQEAAENAEAKAVIRKLAADILEKVKQDTD